MYLVCFVFTDDTGTLPIVSLWSGAGVIWEDTFGFHCQPVLSRRSGKHSQVKGLIRDSACQHFNYTRTSASSLLPTAWAFQSLHKEEGEQKFYPQDLRISRVSTLLHWKAWNREWWCNLQHKYMHWSSWSDLCNVCQNSGFICPHQSFVILSFLELRNLLSCVLDTSQQRFFPPSCSLLAMVTVFTEVHCSKVKSV